MSMSQMIHWELCGNHDLQRAKKGCSKPLEGLTKNEKCKIISGAIIQCNNPTRYQKMVIVVLNEKERTCIIIDIAYPGDNRTNGKEAGKANNSDDLKLEMRSL